MQPESSPQPSTSTNSAETPKEELKLGDLFAKDPKLLTDQDIETIVSTLRANRERWAKEEQEAASQERKVKRSAGTSIKDLNLSDLGLD